MRGNYVPRKAGWDCHGLPVELEVEKELGISSKVEIEEYGIAEFNARCRESVFRYVEEEPAHGADRVLDRPRRPLRHAHQRIHRVGVVVAAPDLGQRSPLQGAQGGPLLPPRRHRALSHEVAQGHQGRRRPIGDVRLPVTDVPPADEIPENSIEAGDNLSHLDDDPLDATSYAAVAAGPEIEYVRARLGEETR